MLREDHLNFELPGARAMFTTVADGDLALDQTANRDRLAADLGLEFAWARQVHGSTVHRVEEPGFTADGDGVATSTSGIGTIVLAADCLPVVITSGRSVVAVHAGWPGLDQGVLAAGIGRLDGPPLAAAIGPGAGPCCYEVGDELRQRFAGYGAERGRNLDLKLIARRQLEAAGVEEIHDAGLCTICSAPDALFSHRRDRGITGRQAGIGWLSS